VPRKQVSTKSVRKPRVVFCGCCYLEKTWRNLPMFMLYEMTSMSWISLVSSAFEEFRPNCRLDYLYMPLALLWLRSLYIFFEIIQALICFWGWRSCRVWPIRTAARTPAWLLPSRQYVHFSSSIHSSCPETFRRPLVNRWGTWHDMVQVRRTPQRCQFPVTRFTQPHTAGLRSH